MKNDISNQLNYLTVLAEEQNLTRAAARLFVSQPALTAYLNRLEASLGAKLFDRSVSPIKITPAGAYYIAQMEKLSIQRGKLLEEIKHIDTDPELKLNIGVGRNRGGIWLPKILPRLYQFYPDAQLSIVEDRDVNMSEKVISGVLDVAIVETYVYHSVLEYLRLPEEFHLMMTSCDSPLVQGMDLSGNSYENPLDIKVERLNEELFICPNIQGQMNRYTQWMCTTYNFKPKRVLTVSNDVTTYQLAVNGGGLGFQNAAYSLLLNTEKRPAFIMPGGKPTRRKVFAIFSDTHMTQLKRDFMKITHNVMSETLYGRRTELEYM